MTNKEIEELYYKLESECPYGGCVSRATIFMEALNKGEITNDIYYQAKKFYGTLWNYVGD